VAGVSPANLQRYHGYHFVIAVLRAKRQNPTHMNPRNTIIAIFATLSASLALSEDFKTVNGEEYKNVAVTRVEPDGIVVKTKSGLSRCILQSCQTRFSGGLITTHNKRLHSLPLRLQIMPQLKINSKSSSSRRNDSKPWELRT
jgi:hypothetical protein